MRLSYRYLLVCLALVLCLQSVAGAPHAAAVRRQDDSPSDESATPTAQESASRKPSATPTLSEASSSRRESDRPSSTVTPSVKPSETPKTSTTSDVPTTTASDEPSPTSSADGDTEGVLPIKPTLTPAMGIAGVFLLLSGLAYAIIGIKNRWLYVSGSGAYLTALAVTVLIIYLMNPPVSNAIQGAFFVAAFFTGVIFGVLAMVFADMTEGFGCLLGGFCLSMWFLSLKDGGLIASSAGRAIFIGCMAAGGYSLSFSHYTRTYGLIASIAFSGATAAILGIDCLAGAGWKEFWLYLWNLNDDIFPLDTNTYPVTKNIKAELAGVIVIAVLGVVSQMRVWKLVKEHRQRSSAQQLERQRDNDREEEEMGRKVEDNFQKERVQWEAAYSGKSMPDSSNRSSVTSPKHSTSVRGKEVYGQDSLEMVNMSKSGVMRSANDNTVPGSTVEDAISQIDAQGNPMIRSTSVAGSDKALPASPENAARPMIIKRNSLKPSAPPPPPSVIPLPFKLPNEDDSHSDDDNTSVSPEPETYDDDNGRPRMSKRISDVSAMRQRISRDVAASQEALIGAHHMDNDGASSIAATFDDDNDVLSMSQLSRPHTPIGTEHDTLIGGVARQDSDTVPTKDVLSSERANAQVPAYEVQKETGADVIQQQQEQQTRTDDIPSRSAMRQSLTTSTDPKADQPRQKIPESGVRADTVVSSSKASSAGRHSKSTRSEALSQGSLTENAESHIGSLKDGALPEKLSKVALSYRTNEWAKHLEAAEKPTYEDMFLPTSPGVILEDGSEEKPAPISDELLGRKRDSRRTSAGSRMQRSSSNGLQRNASTFSQESLVNQRSYTRSPPMASPTGLPRTSSGTRLDILSPLPKNTLMTKRESLIKNRASSLSLTPHTSSTNLLTQQPEEDEENMTLAQRRSLLQQQQLFPGLQHQPPLAFSRKQPPSASQKYDKKPWATTKGGAPPGFDSHQPQRTPSHSDQKREQLYANWRDNMRDVTPPQTAAYVAEQQRVALLNERRQKELEKQQREIVQQQRASQRDSLMRSGPMMEAHREAMRKLQAGASKNANRHT